MRLALVLIVGLSLLGNVAFAQTETQVETTETDAPEEDAEGKSDVEWLAAPIPTRDPNLGWGIGAVGLLIYPLGENSPPSVSSVVGFYFEQGVFAATFHKFFLRNDSIRVTGGGGYGSFNMEYEQINETPLPVNYNQKLGFGMGNILFETFSNLYIGPKYAVNYVVFDPEDPFSELFVRAFNGGELTAFSSGAGAIIEHDTRDSQYYPRAGFQTKALVMAYPEFMGSDSNYELLDLSNAGYRGVEDDVVLAYRVAWKSAHGDVPLSALPRYGQGSNLRGFQTGRYVGEKMATLQGEVRWRVWWRIGIAMFGGVGTIFDSFDEWNSDNLLPSVGVGARFLLAEKNEMNYRFDVSVGRYKGNSAVYFSVGEAF